MPRSIEMVVGCDSCGDRIPEGEQHPGALVLTVNGNGPRQIDLCEECIGTHDIVTLMALFQSVPNMPKQPLMPKPRGKRGNTNTSGEFICPACGDVKPTAQSLGRHTRKEHDATVAEVRAAAA